MRQLIHTYRRTLMQAHREGRLHPVLAEAMNLEPPGFRCSTCGMWAMTQEDATNCCIKGEDASPTFTGWSTVVCVTKKGGELLEALMAIAGDAGITHAKSAEKYLGLYNGYLTKIRFEGFRITDRPYSALERHFPDGVPGVIMHREKNRGQAGKRDRSRDQVHVQGADGGEDPQAVLLGGEGEEVRGNPWGDPGPFGPDQPPAVTERREGEVGDSDLVRCAGQEVAP